MILTLAQMVIVAAKIDNILQISWQVVLLPVLGFFLFLVSAIVFLSIYMVLLYKYYYATFDQKQVTLVYLISGLTGLTGFLIIPLSSTYL